MASVGHLAAGLALGRASGAGRAATLGLVALAFLPDADVIAFPLGIPYEATWGHRGAPHSLALAALIGALIGAVVQARRGGGGLRAALWATAAAASHGLLDALTDGGLGIALLWPWTDARYFAPWRPIPVSPIGASFLSARGLYVATTEALMFSPLLLYAAWPALRRRGR